MENEFTYTDDGVTIAHGPLRIHVRQAGDEEKHGDRYGHNFGKTPIEIELEQDGARFLLNELLAPGWRLVQSSEGQAHCAMKDEGADVFIPEVHEIALEDDDDDYPPYLANPEGLMTALHEIGHSWQIHDLTPEQEQEAMRVRDTLNNHAFTSADSDLLLRQVYWPECDAWRFAMRVRKQLRAIGFDITHSLPEKEMRQKIADDLESYRTALAREGAMFPKDARTAGPAA